MRFLFLFDSRVRKTPPFILSQMCRSSKTLHLTVFACCTQPVAMFLLSVVCCRVRVRGYPPNAVLQREAVAMWTNVRRGDSSHPINWRDGPPQEVRALPQNFLRHAQTANVILRHFLLSFANSFRRSTRKAFLPSCILLSNSPNCHASLRCRHGASSGDRNLHPYFF